jgi:glycosyltransferase involved in cell wall biosynthesis
MGEKAGAVVNSVIVPVYRNQESLPELVGRLEDLAAELDGGLEAVFVVDGSPDESGALLRDLLSGSPLRSQLVWRSRNFGSFAAVRTGLSVAKGLYMAVTAADLQEPAELLSAFYALLRTGEYEVALGVRRSRQDPWASSLSARWFWRIYCRWVQPQMPRGGVDAFACTRNVRNALLALREANSSLIGLLIWLGFRRVEVPYDRAGRAYGRSAWTLRKKARYLFDSVYSFTDLPINLLLAVGVSGVLLSTAGAAAVSLAWLLAGVRVAGYTPLMLAILLMGSSTLSGLGLVGSYVWRTYENSKRRPDAVQMLVETFDGKR